MRSLRLVCALAATLAAHATAPEVFGQQPPAQKQPIRIGGSPAGQGSAPTKGQAPASPAGLERAKQPAVEYDLGRMSQRITALAEQVEALRKENQALSSKLAQFQQATAQNSAAVKQLDAAFHSHTHHMPDIGRMAFSALPGMQDIANKAGIGGVKAQWDTIKVLWATGNGGLGTVGPPIPK